MKETERITGIENDQKKQAERENSDRETERDKKMKRKRDTRRRMITIEAIPQTSCPFQPSTAP